MSATYSIACRDCKKHLWIGQGKSGVKDLRIYSAEKHVQALEKFLEAHSGESHNLIFGDNCDEPIVEFEEINQPS